MDYDSIGMLFGGFYAALCAGLSDEGVRVANDVLYELAESSARPEEARIFRLVARSAGKSEQPSLTVIQGGAA